MVNVGTLHILFRNIPRVVRLDEMAHDVNEVVLTRDGSGDDGERSPVISPKKVEHRAALVLDGRRQEYDCRFSTRLKISNRYCECCRERSLLQD